MPHIKTEMVEFIALPGSRSQVNVKFGLVTSVVVKGRQKNLPTIVMHEQSCCVLTKTDAFLMFPLTLPSCYRKVSNDTVEPQLSGHPRGTGK